MKKSTGLATAIGLMLLTGCAGHGNYTKEGISLARQRLDTLKAATEYDMARQAFLAGDLDKAMKKADLALALTSDNPLVYVLRGRIFIERGSMGEALLSLGRALELDGNSVDARYYLGVVHERLSEPERALEHFTAAATLNGYNPQYPIAAGEMLIDLGRTEEARALLTASPAAASSAGIQQLLGHLALIEGRADEACDLFTRARLLAPDDGAILEDLTGAQLAAGRFADAEQNTGALLRDAKNRGRRDLLHMRASALLALDRPVEARQIYRDMVAGDGASDASAWGGLGRASYRIGDGRELRRAASRVVAIAPANPEGYILWAMWHRLEGDPVAALEKIETGLKRGGDHAELIGVKALLLAELGRNTEALAAARRALDLDPGNASCRTLVDTLSASVAVPVW